MRELDDEFEISVGSIRDKGGSAGRKVTRVTASRLARRGRGGRVMGPLRQQTARASGLRRAVVKARIVKMGGSSGGLRAHLHYLQRDGREIGQERGRLYSALEDDASGRAFMDRTEGDRHQFRFIVSPEDGRDLDLKAYTRELMDQMARDLRTRLDWVAVDHRDTEHPHTHVLVRGVTDKGTDLLIAQDYITEGLRLRAREIATEHLGPRQELEIVRRAWEDVEKQRFTGLDRSLLRDARDGVLDLRDGGEGSRRDQELRRARLTVLEREGLARQVRPQVWSLSPDLESELRWRGEQGDIIRAMNRALARQGEDRERARDLVTHDGELVPMIGRVIDKGLAGPTEERAALFIDGVDGKVRRLEVSLRAADQVPMHAIVRIGVGATQADRTIAEIAGEQGTYRTDEHRRRLEMGELARPEGADARDIVASHERRLEALRRARVVSRYEAGRWSIPKDFLEQAARYEQRRGIVRVVSGLDLDRQVRSLGATWLDRQLVAREPLELADRGFGLEVKRALEDRTRVLEGRELAHRRGDALSFAPGLLQTLTLSELRHAGEAYARKRGLEHRLTVPGQEVRGIYAERLSLDSGLFAVVTSERSFTLVPWRAVIEPHRGREVRGVVEPGLGISWELGRERELKRDRGREIGFDDGPQRGRGMGLGR